MNKRRVIILICFLVQIVVSHSQAQHNQLPKTKNKVVLIAHRGNHVLVPENTVASTKEAISAGVDYVEVDLRTTRDGYLVALHDATVDRTTNGQGKVSEMTLSQVEALQVFNRNKKTLRIPQFHEILEVCKGKINIYLDFKDADPEKTWKQIKVAGMEHQVIVYINKKEQYGEWKKVAPNLPLMTSLPENVKTEAELNQFLDHFKVEVVDNVTNPEFLKVLRNRKIQVWLDVQSPTEGPQKWQEALDRGAEGIQTDKPGELVRYIRNNNP
ncbi:hypothetical protein DYBT9275_04591 [Dyadobacter sp. CECT 9275]|uniref:GP-PDE domain-containing protein n=1 Tax=Dyadobacter helix TaxID=2822344 RepID=A0A916JEQ0_9BACT|nr:glycerophosphodiester phosphodiesterase family protein [Dyadobacter sp. CECT 9275]CAG5009893.1 hypothetical protein DYBT9275_04591 [Dyadobacter sp. CECT 9275]